MQRSYMYFHKERQVVRGVFYPQGESGQRILCKMVTFKELDLDVDGNPLKG